MTAYSLYLDDSGHPDDRPFVVVAGYVASENQWRQFESNWNQALARHALGSEFHMTSFMGERRSELKRDLILANLCGIIKKHTAGRFACCVDMAAYRQINEKYALEECLGAPFALDARYLGVEIRKWARENLKPEDHLSIFVEQGTKRYGDMEQVFKRDRLPRPVRVSKSTAAVQTADMLAWEMLRFLRSNKLRKNLKRLMPRHSDFGSIFQEDDLEATCIEANVFLRSTLKPGDTIAFHSERKRKRKRTIR